MVSDYSYTLDARGRRTVRGQSGTAFASAHEDSFAYDYLGQLLAVANDTFSSTAYNPVYRFDGIGNRDGVIVDVSGSVNYVANGLNQYVTVGTVTPSYDADGNLSAYGAWTYTWDGENRLIGATNGTTTLGFEYDYQGRLVRRDDGSTETVYLYDGWNRIARFVNSSLVSTNLWGLDISGSLQGAGGVGGLLREGNLYPLYDANGNITQKLNSSGSTVMAVEYDPFGNVISGSLVGEYGFSTKPLDADLGWHYYGYRWYDAEAGRWPSRDPIEERGGPNLYALVGNDPVNAWDYLGLWKIARNGFEWAFALAESGDTIESLATHKDVGLNASEASKWFKTAKGEDADPSQIIEGCRYKIPNTIGVYTMGTSADAPLKDRVNSNYWGTVAVLKTEAQIQSQGFRDRGWKIVSVLDGSSRDSFTSIWELDGIHGIIMAGHGNDSGDFVYYINAWNPLIVRPSSVNPPYKLGLVVNISCGSIHTNWRDHVSPNGTYIGFSNYVFAWTWFLQWSAVSGPNN